MATAPTEENTVTDKIRQIVNTRYADLSREHREVLAAAVYAADAAAGLDFGCVDEVHVEGMSQKRVRARLDQLHEQNVLVLCEPERVEHGVVQQFLLSDGLREAAALVLYGDESTEPDGTRRARVLDAVLYSLEADERSAREALAKLAAKLTDERPGEPAHGLEWSLQEFQAAAKLEAGHGARQALDAAGLDGMADEAAAQVTRRARALEQSSSPAANVMNRCRLAAWAELLELARGAQRSLAG